MSEGDRPQDVGRSHARRGAPSPETAALLARYQEAMRVELRAVLAELDGKPGQPGLIDETPPVVRPTLAERMRLWDLAIKIGRELGSAIDADPVPVVPAAPAKRARRRRVEYG